MRDYVVDASAILVALFGEAGADQMDAYATGDGRLLISTVNLTEVFSKLLDRGMSMELAGQLLLPLGLDHVAHDADLAGLAARLRPATRPAGLSMGDRCCLALAKARGLAVLTADRAWTEVAEAVGVEVIVTRPET